MKHDYMTDRNWKLEEPAETASENNFLKTFILALIVIIILLGAAVWAWHYLKKEHTKTPEPSAVVTKANNNPIAPSPDTVS